MFGVFPLQSVLYASAWLVARLPCFAHIYAYVFEVLHVLLLQDRLSGFQSAVARDIFLTICRIGCLQPHLVPCALLIILIFLFLGLP